MDSHFLFLFIWDDKGESINRVCEDFHKPNTAGKMSTQDFNRKAVGVEFIQDVFAFLSRSMVRRTSIDIARRKSVSRPSGSAR